MRARLALREEASVYDAARAGIASKAPSQGPPLEAHDKSRPEVFVLFTTLPRTLAALKKAFELSASLGLRVEVLMLYQVPYTLPLEARALPEGFLENQVRALQSDLAADISLRVILCRRPWRALRQVLPPRALIVLGGRKRRWPLHESWLANILRRDGHEVVFAELG
jgi:hypothetical protein